jgi:protein-tyrosine phosphatase
VNRISAQDRYGLRPDYRAELPNCHNFRDLGGIETAPGLQTRPGLLYRSGRLTFVTEAEQQFLTQLGIRRVIDLRSRDEIRAHPDRIPASWKYVQIAMEEGSLGLEAVVELFRSAMEGKADTAVHIEQNYREMPELYAGHLRRVFALLTADSYVPTVIHCTAGKDRTGFFSALFLYALGADDEAVLSDYLQIGFRGSELETAAARYARQFETYQLNLDPVHTYPLLETRPEFLLAAVSSIRSRYASVGDYLRETVGLSDQGLLKLRRRFLTGAR